MTRKQRQSLLTLFATFLLVGELLAQEKSPALTYLDEIGNQFTIVSNDMMSYTSAVSHGKSARKIEKKRAEVMQSLRDAVTNVKRLKPFQKDASLRDSVVSYFQLSALVLKEDYGKIVNLEEVAEQSYDAMEAYMLTKELADQKLHEAL